MSDGTKTAPILVLVHYHNYSLRLSLTHCLLRFKDIASLSCSCRSFVRSPGSVLSLAYAKHRLVKPCANKTITTTEMTRPEPYHELRPLGLNGPGEAAAHALLSPPEAPAGGATAAAAVLGEQVFILDS